MWTIPTSTSYIMYSPAKGIPRWYHDETNGHDDEKLRKILNSLVSEPSGWASACLLTFKSSKYLWPYGPYDMLVLSTSWLFSLKSTAFIWHQIRLWNVFFISYDDLFRYQRCCLQSDVNLSTCKIGHQHLKLVTNPNCIQHPSSKWIKPFFDPVILKK